MGHFRIPRPDFRQRLRIGVALVGYSTVIASLSSAGQPAGAILPTSPPPGEVTTPEIDAPETAPSWAEVMIPWKQAMERNDQDRIIELMNQVMLQNLSNEQVAIALTARGVAEVSKHATDKAMADFDQALRIDPHYSLAYDARANLSAQKGDFQEAIRDLDEAIALQPTMPKPYQTRGALYGRLHQYDNARANFDKVIELDPKSAEAYVMRASVWLHDGDNRKALDDARRAEAIDPTLLAIYSVRVRAYIRANRLPEARRQLALLASWKGKEPEKPLNSIAWTRATCPDERMRDGKEAVKLATKACELSQWKSPHTLDTLAASYAEAGDFDSAVKYEQRAIDLDLPEVQDLTPAMNDRLALYRRHEPYRDQESF